MEWLQEAYQEEFSANCSTLLGPVCTVLYCNSQFTPCDINQGICVIRNCSELYCPSQFCVIRLGGF